MNLGDRAVGISVEVAGGGAADTAEATRLLSGELVRYVGVHVRSEEAAVPQGAKSGGAFFIGSLVVSGVLSPMTVRELVRLAVAFVERGAARRVVLEQDGDKLILEAAPAATQKALADAWMERRLTSSVESADLGQPSSDQEDRES